MIIAEDACAMLRLLPGLGSILSDEDCERVELHSVLDDAVLVFLREGADAWIPADRQSEPVHTRELQATIQRGLGQGYDRLVCFLPREEVVYAAEGGGVRLKRLARSEQRRDAETGPPDLTGLADALGIPKSKRKAKFRQAYQFSRIAEQALAGMEKGALRILDLACGRSYLGFVLVHLLAAGGREVALHGVDSDRALVDKCHEIARTLRWTNSTFELADIADYSVAPGAYDIVVSLHACDTLTDEAIRIACEAQVPLLFAAPCCQHEFRHLWKEHPLQWVSRYGLLEQRLADVLTDGFRCLVLEAMGYQVKVLRFTAPDVTPKNVLIQARLTSGPRPDRARDAEAFLKRFRLRPRLAAVLEAAGLRRRSR